MSARRHLNPDQFRLVHDADDPGLHSIEAFHPDFGGGNVSVGSMLIDKSNSRITNINVDQSHRRQGIGRKMYSQAQQLGLNPLHSPAEHKTALGKKWSAGVGGDAVTSV